MVQVTGPKIKLKTQTLKLTLTTTLTLKVEIIYAVQNDTEIKFNIVL